MAAGSYNERPPVVTQAVTLRGAQAGIDARGRSNTSTAGESTITQGIDIDGPDIRLDGFRILRRVLATQATDARIVNNLSQTSVDGVGTIDVQLAGSGTILKHNFFDNGTNGDVVDDPTTDADERDQVNGVFTGTDNEGGADNAQIVENRFRGHESSAINVNQNSRDLTIAGNTFSDEASGLVATDASDLNITDNVGTGFEGTALFFAKGVTDVSITGNTLNGGTSSGIAITGFNFGNARPSSGFSIVGNSLTGLATAISTSTGSYSGELEIHYNRIAGNTQGLRANLAAPATIDAENNFWGCNTGPTGTTGACDSVFSTSTPAGTADATPYLQLRTSASPSSIFTGGDASQITSSVRTNSDNQNLGSIPFPEAPVTFATTKGTLDAASATLVDGLAGATLTSDGTVGTATVTATRDNAVTATPVTFKAPPAGTPGTQGPAGTNDTSGVTPSSTPTTTKRVVVNSKTVTFSKKSRKAVVRVTCPRSNGLCEGTIKIVYKGKVIGRQAFLIRGSRSGKFTIKLSKSSLKKLGKGKSGSVNVFSRDRAGTASSSSSKAKLKVGK